LFLCARPLQVRWNPLLNNNFSDYLRAFQNQIITESLAPPEESSAASSDWLDLAAQGIVSFFQSLGRQLRQMGNGLNPPSSAEAAAMGTGGVLFGCAARRPFEANSPVVAAPPVSIPNPPRSAETRSEPVSPLLRPLQPGISMAELERTFEMEQTTRTAQIILVRLDLSRVTLGLREIPDQEFSNIRQAQDIDVAINGGFFELNLSPSGLMISEGRSISPLGPRGGSGVLVVENGRARLVSSDAFDPSASHPNFAIQCGPRLIEIDGSNGIRSSAVRVARRTALCIRDGGRTLDWVVAYQRDDRLGPSLYTLATWLHEGLLPGERGCDAALNLDGGPSTGIYVRGAQEANLEPGSIVIWALTAHSRP
jgi:uncharacterized protein YigE (DUF2233 family)